MICVFLLSFSIGSSAQEVGHTGPAEENADQLEFMVGDWEIVSNRNITAFDENVDTDAEAVWEETVAVANIVPHLDGNAYLQHWIGTMGDELVEATFFHGIRGGGQTWDIIWADSHLLGIHLMQGNFDQDDVFVADGSIWQSSSTHLVINNITENSFQWTLSVTDGVFSTDYSDVWMMTYTRITDDSEATYDELAETIRASGEMPAPPDGIDGFSFWIGEWNIDSMYASYDFEPLPARSSIQWVNGGHAFEEHWIALWDIDEQITPFEAFSLSIFNTESNTFNNVWWQIHSGSPQRFNTGTCSGDGADYQCRLAGVFYNITENTIDWYIGSENSPNWRLAFQRRDGE